MGIVSDALDRIDDRTAKKILVVAALGGLAYFFFVAYGGSVQHATGGIMYEYVTRCPDGMAIKDMTMTHQIFPPRFGVVATYEPIESALY